MFFFLKQGFSVKDKGLKKEQVFFKMGEKSFEGKLKRQK